MESKKLIVEGLLPLEAIEQTDPNSVDLRSVWLIRRPKPSRFECD